jgi:RHS repeat-associated protein
MKSLTIRGVLWGLTAFSSCVCLGQDNSVVTPPAYSSTLYNYVRSWSAVLADTADADVTTASAVQNFRMTTEYFDGLGKPLQTVTKQGSWPSGGSAADLVTAIAYDNYDRVPRVFLPFVANYTGGNTSITDGYLKTNPFQQQDYFYSDANAYSPVHGQGETYYYGLTVFEGSPLNRSARTYAAGNSWVHNGKGLTYSYDVNTALDSVEIIHVRDTTLGLFGTYTPAGYYVAGDLLKTITSDENGKQVIQFSDKQNRVLLKKVQLTAAADNGAGSGPHGWLSTYYVYDYKSRLRAVIQPAGVVNLVSSGWTFTSTLLSQQVFRYEYDGRARTILKQVPGAGVVYTVYDGRDLPVMVQDSNLRAQGKWLYTLYDAIDRPEITGFVAYTGSWSQLQALVTGQTGSYSTGNVSISGQSAGTVPSSLTFSTPQTGDWYASTVINLDTGFAVSTGQEFSGNIAAGGTMMESSGSVQISDNPIPSGLTPTILTVTYYDNYAWANNSGLGSSFAEPAAPEFITSYNAAPDYAQQMTPGPSATGLVTGTMALVMGTSNQYLYTASFYDSYHRVIQTRQINYKGQLDVQTTQYNFTGKPLRVYVQHDNAASATDAHNVMTRISYDAEQRESSVWKNIDGAATDQLIDSLQYDALGQLRVKYLGKDPVSGNPLDSLVYDYNIRSWVLGINRNFIGGTTQHYFGLELGYDKSGSISGATYNNPAYNGNIGGLVWKSAGDGVDRKYDFIYDAANRLLGAAYQDNYNAGSWGRTAMDYSVDSLGYDPNGNLQTMNQHGFKVGNPTGNIDVLSYNYEYGGGSNKLTQVQDAANDTASLLGDFHYKGAKADSDYRYDGNGNLTIDNNKGIDSIYYNYLNLPQQVHFKGKGNIFYTYDAAGNKLQKQVIDSLASLATTTTYVDGGFQFQRRSPISNPSGGTDTLQFIGHEEGRTRWAFLTQLSGNTAYNWEYDFMERDHLGNTRVVLTQERDTTEYMATMEPQFRTTENALFYNIDSTSYAASAVPHGGFPAEPKGPSPNDSVAMVDGAGHEIGPAILLKVMSGDSISIACYAYYASGGTVTSPNSSFNSLLTSLATGLFSLTAGTHGTTAAMTNASSGPVYSAAGNFLSTRDSNTTVAPKAYLNWILLNDQLNYVSGNNQSGVIYIGQPNILNTLGTSIKLNHNGFIYIWVSNETPNWPCFFDNLSIEHFTGPLLEENHYYPGGLTMAGISDMALKSQYPQNKLRYNSKEMQNQEFADGSGLEQYDYGARMYDPQICRWEGQDKFSEVYVALTPYHYAANNPIKIVDAGGHLLKDKDGNIIATSTGEMYTRSQDYSVDGKSYHVEATYNEVVVYTDQGTPIKALQLINQDVKQNNDDGSMATVVNSPFDASQNCHGTTFADAKLVIVDGSAKNESVETILTEDGYSNNNVNIDNADIFVMRFGGDDFHSGKINDDGSVTSDHDLGKPQTTTLNDEINAASTPDGTSTTLYQKASDDKVIDTNLGTTMGGVRLISADEADFIRKSNGLKTSNDSKGTFEHTVYKKKKKQDDFQSDNDYN